MDLIVPQYIIAGGGLEWAFTDDVKSRFFCPATCSFYAAYSSYGVQVWLWINGTHDSPNLGILSRAPYLTILLLPFYYLEKPNRMLICNIIFLNVLVTW